MERTSVSSAESAYQADREGHSLSIVDEAQFVEEDTDQGR
jgi:hypothetical protein